MSFHPLRYLTVLTTLLLLMAPAVAAGAPADLTAFVDQEFGARLDEHKIPGAAVAIVRDGALVFAKGYGWADIDRRIPFDPQQTIFRAKSVSKLFTATAVMQLAEQGRIQMDGDVNAYLKGYQVPTAFGRPVTPATLLTHTAGFQDHGLYTIVRTASELEPIGEYLARRMPPRIYPPGATFSYTDHGTTLAGYLVEQVTGMKFDQYIQENILRPLQMNDSSFAQPQPPALAARMARGYWYESGQYVPKDWGFFQVAPAVSLVTTTADMAHFMIAHLNTGQYGDTRILTDATAREMQRQHFTYDPHLDGMAYGFFELNVSGYRALQHTGGGHGFTTWLLLVPELNTGIFIAINRNDSGALQPQFAKEYLTAFFPARQAPSPAVPMAGYQERAARYAGTYAYYRNDRSTVEKMSTREDLTVTANPDGSITVPGTGRMVEVEPLLFQTLDGSRYVAFRADSAGRITQIAVRQFGYTRLHWWELKLVHAGALGLSLLSFAWVLLSWAAGSLRRRTGKTATPVVIATPGRNAGLATGLLRAASAANLLFAAALVITLLYAGEGGGTPLDYGLPRSVYVLLCLPILSLLMTAGCAISSVLAWRQRLWAVVGWIQYSLVTLLSILFLMSLWYWNLMGFKI